MTRSRAAWVWIAVGIACLALSGCEAATPPPRPPAAPASPAPPAAAPPAVTATAAPVATPEPVAVAGGAPSPPPERPAEKVVPAREQDFPARVPGGEIGGEPGGEIGGEPGGVVGSATEPSLGDVLRGTGLAPPSTATLPFGEGMTRPVLLSGRQPQYTAEALDAKVEGKVIARCTITREGRLVACKIIKGLPGLDNEVLAALATQRYRPVLYQGKPQAVFYTLPFRFKLDAPPPPKPGG